MKYNYKLAALFAVFSSVGTWGFGNDWHDAVGVGAAVGLVVLSISIFVVNIESKNP